MSPIVICLAILVITTGNKAARILAMVPTPSLSHQIVMYPIVQELAKKHEVVFITTNPAFPKGETPKNLTEIDIQEISYKMWRQEFTVSKFGKQNFIHQGIRTVIEVIPRIFEKQMKSEVVQQVIQNEKPFDLILLQGSFRPALIWSHIYKVPVIQISSVGMIFDNQETVGAPIHPILYPDVLHQRIYNLSLWETVTELYKRYYVDSVSRGNEAVENELLRRSFGPDVPDLSELRKNVHMLFINLSPLWDRNRPLPKNVVYFGNVHQKPEKELPKDIKAFLDGSKRGAIYISFGTNVPPSKLPAGFVQNFLNVISEIPFNVLWKWDQDQLPGKPDNLMISKWFPQSDVFRHPNMKLVITQGGLQTTEEAIKNGLPLLGIPMLADQWLNTENYVHHGIGMQLDMETLDEKQLRKAVLTVSEDASYRNNVLRLRSIINHQPTTPLRRAVSWIEYTLKHGGAHHLRPLAANMSRAEYIELELLILLLVTIITILSIVAYALFLTLKCIKTLLFRRVMY